MSNFKRPANGQYRHYCGECARFAPVEHEYARGMGVCSFDDLPSGKVSLAYMMTAVWRDQYEGACPLFEGRADHD